MWWSCSRIKEAARGSHMTVVSVYFWIFPTKTGTGRMEHGVMSGNDWNFFAEVLHYLFMTVCFEKTDAVRFFEWSF